MLNWLFKKNKPMSEETKFSKLPTGQQFKKLGSWDEKIYIKTDDFQYQTTNDGWHCPRWYLVREDFEIKTIL